jgi:hypothetical protein
MSAPLFVSPFVDVSMKAPFGARIGIVPKPIDMAVGFSSAHTGHAV